MGGQGYFCDLRSKDCLSCKSREALRTSHHIPGSPRMVGLPQEGLGSDHEELDNNSRVVWKRIERSEWGREDTT